MYLTEGKKCFDEVYHSGCGSVYLLFYYHNMIIINTIVHIMSHGRCFPVVI